MTMVAIRKAYMNAIYNYIDSTMQWFGDRHDISMLNITGSCYTMGYSKYEREGFYDAMPQWQLMLKIISGDYCKQLQKYLQRGLLSNGLEYRLLLNIEQHICFKLHLASCSTLGETTLSTSTSINNGFSANINNKPCFILRRGSVCPPNETKSSKRPERTY